MAASQGSVRDKLTWGNTLDYEPAAISNRAKQLFQRAKTKFSVESGHSIQGVSGNDRALACLCVFLAKVQGVAPGDRKALEVSLQRPSGVTARIFSKAHKELSLILGTSPTDSSKSPKKTDSSRTPRRTGSASQPTTSKAGSIRESQEALLNPSSLKRPAPAPLESPNGGLDSPTNPKRIRTSQKPSSSRRAMPDSQPDSPSRTPRPNRLGEPSSIRTIKKTPLNLPIQLVPKPMSIFQSYPIFNRQKPNPKLNFSDWNWKSHLFQQHWSLQDIRQWESWNQQSIENSLV